MKTENNIHVMILYVLGFWLTIIKSVQFMIFAYYEIFTAYLDYVMQTKREQNGNGKRHNEYNANTTPFHYCNKIVKSDSPDLVRNRAKENNFDFELTELLL